MSVGILVSASTWIPVSAYYPHDANIQLPNTYIRWSDGYSAFEHEAFKHSSDYSINRDTVFYLPSSKSLFECIRELQLDPVVQGTYLSLSVNASGYFNPSRQYVVVNDNSLHLNSLSADSGFFRFLINDNGTFSLMQGYGTFVTVADKTPFNLTLETELPQNEIYRQQFYWHEYEDKIYFTTKTYSIVNGNQIPEERFWSFSKVGPEKGRIRASGLLPFADYITPDNVYFNDYLFDVNDFMVSYIPTGLVSDHNWVRYHNELVQKENNRNVEIFEERSTSGVYINHLFDLPYNTQINTTNKSMAVNFANLKNVMTPEYRYRVKEETPLPTTTPAPTTTTTTTTLPPFIPCGSLSRYVTGTQSYPTSSIHTLGTDTGVVRITGTSGNIPDKFIVYFDGVEVINTGYVGNTGYWPVCGMTFQQALDIELAARGLPSEPIVYNPDWWETGPGDFDVSFIKSSSTTVAYVSVFAPLQDTGWWYTIYCPE